MKLDQFLEQHHLKTAIVYGPMGCGKTHNAKSIARHFGIPETNIVDDWEVSRWLHGRRTLTPGFLYLTIKKPKSSRLFHIPHFVQIVNFADLPLKGPEL